MKGPPRVISDPALVGTPFGVKERPAGPNDSKNSRFYVSNEPTGASKSVFPRRTQSKLSNKSNIVENGLVDLELRQILGTSLVFVPSTQPRQGRCEDWWM